MQHREHREYKTSKKLHLVSLFPNSVNSIRFAHEKDVKKNSVTTVSKIAPTDFSSSVSSVKKNSVSSVVKIATTYFSSSVSSVKKHSVSSVVKKNKL
jgi:hypothetical protein